MPTGLGEPKFHDEKLKQIENNPDKIIRTCTFQRLEDMYLHKGPRMEPEEVIKTAKGLFEEFEQDYAIPVTVDFVIGKDEQNEKVVYVINNRIDGTDLGRLRKEEMKELKEQLDALYHAVVSYFTRKLLSGEYYLVDIFKPAQYVYGTAPHEEEKKIYLVDTDIFFHNAKTGIYMNIAETIKYVQVLEEYTEEKFTHTHQALQEFLNIESISDPNDPQAAFFSKRIDDYKASIEKFVTAK